MRHRVFGNQLNRSTKHRQALHKNLAQALVLHGTIETTTAKAKVLAQLIAKYITHAKANTLASRRLIQSYFNDQHVAHKLVDVIAPALANHPGGYTKITRLGPRRGDDAMMVRITFSEPIPEPVAKPKTLPAPPKPKAKVEAKK